MEPGSNLSEAAAEDLGLAWLGKMTERVTATSCQYGYRCNSAAGDLFMCELLELFQHCSDGDGPVWWFMVNGKTFFFNELLVSGFYSLFLFVLYSVFFPSQSMSPVKGMPFSGVSL